MKETTDFTNRTADPQQSLLFETPASIGEICS
jgi:hypothetical protein